MTAPATQNLTILLTDIKGFTDKTSRKTRSDIQAMLDKHRGWYCPCSKPRAASSSRPSATPSSWSTRAPRTRSWPGSRFRRPSGPAKLWRRAAALVLDTVLCSVLVGVLVPGEQTRVRIKKGPASAEAKPPSAEEVKIGSDGIKVRNKDVNVSIDASGIEISDGSGGETLYDEDGWRVGRSKRRKEVAFPLFWLLYGTLFLSLWSILLLGYLWAFWEKEKRGWHDLWAGTLVIERN